MSRELFTIAGERKYLTAEERQAFIAARASSRTRGGPHREVPVPRGGERLALHIDHGTWLPRPSAGSACGCSAGVIGALRSVAIYKIAARIAGHESKSTPAQLYNRTHDELSLDEIERIRI